MEVCDSLAEQLVADAEGATRHFRVAVDGAADATRLVSRRASSRRVRWSKRPCTAATPTGDASSRRSAAAARTSPSTAAGLPSVASSCSIAGTRAGRPRPRARCAVEPAHRHRHRPRRRRRLRSRLGMRSVPGIRPHQRRLHHLISRRASTCQNRPSTNGSSARRCSSRHCPTSSVSPGTSSSSKSGGAASAAADLDAVLEDIVLLRFVGMRPVIVHGGGPEISAWQERMGIEPKFVNGLRVTDAPTWRSRRWS